MVSTSHSSPALVWSEDYDMVDDRSMRKRMNPHALFSEQKEEAPKKEDNPNHVGPFWESKIFKEGG